MMRIFAVSDIHADYRANAQWVHGLSSWDYKNDVLLLAGDISDSLVVLAECLEALAVRFRHVLFVPGNHELWVLRDRSVCDSLGKFARVCKVARESGAAMAPLCLDAFAIVPLLGWYDYSFGEAHLDLQSSWMDFRACRWPDGWQAGDVAKHFLSLNEPLLHIRHHTLITFSHFLPRLDLMPAFIPIKHQAIYPVLGAWDLDRQVRALGAKLHVYGHSHLNRSVRIDGVHYVNNAYGYPSETHIAAKRMACVHEVGA
jgi:predicted phosphodiesterase